jgi:hypothetical protein
VKSVADLDVDPESAGGKAEGTSTSATTDAEDDAPSVNHLAARARAVAEKGAALTAAILDTRRRGVTGQTLIALRRLSGAIGGVCDALDEALGAAVVDDSMDRVASRYVECALWWATQLVDSLRDALARGAESDRRRIAVAAAEFASLYALGHLDSVKNQAGAGASRVHQIDALHDEILWLAASLREELE